MAAAPSPQRLSAWREGGAGLAPPLSAWRAEGVEEKNEPKRKLLCKWLPSTCGFHDTKSPPIYRDVSVVAVVLCVGTALGSLQVWVSAALRDNKMFRPEFSLTVAGYRKPISRVILLEEDFFFLFDKRLQKITHVTAVS